MGRRLGHAYSRTLREGMAGGRNRPREPSGPGLCRALRRPFGAPGSADAIAGAARQRPLGTVARRSLPDLRLPGHRKPLTRARSAATRPPPKPSQKSCPFLLNRIPLVLRVIHTIHQAMTHHRSYQIRYTGESRCPRQNRVGRFLTVPPSHTTGRTDRVPRRFLCAFNAGWRTDRLIIPCSSNQAMSMAIFACGELARHHQPLPDEASSRAW